MALKPLQLDPLGVCVTDRSRQPRRYSDPSVRALRPLQQRSRTSEGGMMGKYKPKRQRRKAAKKVKRAAGKKARNATVRRWLGGK